MESCGVSEYCISSKWKRNPVTVRSESSLCCCLMADLFLDTTLFLFCILHSPSSCSPPVFSGYPPVSQWLDHFGPGLPACGHLFTSSSISRHGCNPPTITTTHPHPCHRPFSALLSCFPQTPAVNHLCLSAVNLVQPCDKDSKDRSASGQCALLYVCWPRNI